MRRRIGFDPGISGTAGGCSVADVALAAGLPPGRVVAIGKRTLRRAQWLGRIAADPDTGGPFAAT